jgi:hypothetical protein
MNAGVRPLAPFLSNLFYLSNNNEGLIGRLRLKISLIKGSEESYRALLRMRRTCQQPDAR